ncbi:Hypothetical predicted protein [Paramuricea clavata]|uniref:Uncharacterized protein n=1 Tax=Paramuricea clavata TaxID=317549 RepID=A0A6S7FU45_PARCT|nr:Hypothetical predicted protein [Paramuricea clavata]
MHTGEEIIHTTASENLSFATGWLFLSIALGSILTFTFFTAISTSFYCCQKPIKKKDKDTQSLINTGNSSQKLRFPNVPSTVYPTIQSILQQEDNEVIDSLCPAYRELPSTHFSYVSSFNGSITTDSNSCGNDQTTILPNSTKSSVHPHTTSQSSDQLNIQRISNGSTSNPDPTTNSSRSINIASTVEDPTISQESPSLTNPDLIDDGSLSIHIITAPEDPQRYPTLSTSGIITEGDQTIQREGNKNSRIEPTMNNGQLNEPATNDDQRSNEPAMNDGRLSEPAVNDQRLNDQRLCTGPIKNAATSVKNANNAIIYDSSRGASSFGGVELSPKTRAFSPDYYALTFRREGSGLSDVSCGSLRGASAFAGSSEQQRSPMMMSRVHERGASAFGQTSEGLHVETGGSCMNKTGELPKRQTESLNLTHESLLNYKGSQLGTGRSCTMGETGDEAEISNHIHASPINYKAVKTSPNPNHSVAETTVNSVPSVEGNSSKLQCHCVVETTLDSVHSVEGNCENQYLERFTKFPTFPRAVSAINKRPNSSTSTKSYRVNVEKGERASGIRSDSQNDSGKKNREKSITPQLYNSSEMKPNKKLITSSNNHITANSQQHVALDKPIKTFQTTPRENTTPITILQNTPRDSSKPIKILDTKSNPKTQNLNTTYQSLRGASQLGRLGDDDVCSDNDAFWDSVSLSFAYDSPSEEDSVSHIGFKEN